MSRRSDDLMPLLAQQPPRPLRLVQGVVGAWNSSTGENTVAVGDSGYADLPIIGAHNLTGITGGDQIMVLDTGTARYILGKLIKP